jgi:repressor LexA
LEKARIIKELIEKKGLNAKVFSEKAGIPYTTLRSILERGVSKSSVENIIKICRALGITVEDLERIASGEMFTSVGEMVLLPIYGKISCGNGTIAYESIEGYEATPKDWLNGGDYFYLRAKGDSMTGARINGGDLLLIRKQPEVENGEIAAVLIGDDALLKKVYKNGDALLLQSENPAYPPIFCPPAEAVIIGKLKMVTIKF